MTKKFFNWFPKVSNIKTEIAELERRLAEETNPKMREALLISIRDLEIELYH